MIGDPPLLALLKVHYTERLVLVCARTVGVVGLPGTFAGIISRKPDGELEPTILLAITLNLYFWPVVIPDVK